MKKLILSCLMLGLTWGVNAQADIKTSFVSLSANNINVGSSTKLRYNVQNAGSSGSSYDIGQVQIVLSIPSSVFSFSSVDLPNGSLFNWTYNATENVLIGINHTAIGQNENENVDINLIGTTAGTATGNINVELEPSASNLSADNDPTLFNLTVLGILPVRLIGFNGKRVINGNQLNWNTASEVNFSHYEIERSLNSKEFKTISKINASSSKSYSYVDDFANAITHNAYYRLKMVDLDGTFELSKVIYLNSDSENSFVGAAYPNPVIGQTTNVEIKSNKNMPWEITTYDMAGKQISKTNTNLNKGNNTVAISTKGASAGLLLVSYVSEDGIFSEKIMIK